MPDRTDPIRPTDDEARALARGLVAGAATAALAFVHPESGAPFVSRIALGRAPDGTLLTLVSDLSLHTRALLRDPRAALLAGEPGPRGDPLNSPRLSLAVRARFVADDDPQRKELREAWLAQHPKARLYVDFADFRFVAFTIEGAALNGGFGRAYSLAPEDLS